MIQARAPFWTDKEDRFLKRHYPTTTATALSKRMNRSTNGIALRARRLGIISDPIKHSASIKWTKRDMDYLKENYATEQWPKLCKRLNRKMVAIRTMATKQGLSKPRAKPTTLTFANGKLKYRIDPTTQCWNWIGSISHKGYAIGRGANTTYAYRQRYIDKHGVISDEVEIDHLCKNRRCVNIDHLEAVTHIENIRRGSNGFLTIEQVREIRSDETMNNGELARKFGVGRSAIAHIRKGRSWRETR